MNIETKKETAQAIAQLAVLGAEAQLQQLKAILDEFQQQVAAASSRAEASNDDQSE